MSTIITIVHVFNFCFFLFEYRNMFNKTFNFFIYLTLQCWWHLRLFSNNELFPLAACNAQRFYEIWLDNNDLQSADNSPNKKQVVVQLLCQSFIVRPIYYGPKWTCTITFLTVVVDGCIFVLHGLPNLQVCYLFSAKF